MNEIQKLLRIEDALVAAAEKDLRAAEHSRKRKGIIEGRVRVVERRAARSRVQRILLVARAESQENDR
jgi:hypothetical protein